MLKAKTNSSFRQLFKRSQITQQLFLLFLLIIIADLFFFNKSLGLSVPLFIMLTTISVALISWQTKKEKMNLFFFCIPILSSLPGIETFNVLTLIIGMSGLIIFAVMVNGKDENSFVDWLKTFLVFFVSVPVRLFRDASIISHKISRSAFQKTKFRDVLTASLVPLLFSIGFIILFAIANPLISQWMLGLDVSNIFTFNILFRILLWVTMAIAIWPLLRVAKLIHTKRKVAEASKNIDKNSEKIGCLQTYLSQSTVTFSLIAFNLIFAIQTYLDMVYLWGNSQLPQGMSYADYVHKGVYTLIFTVLIAVIFILFVLNKNKETEHSDFTKGLIFLWTLQNIILLISTLMRMQLYIEAFALTYLRVSALIWMVLVLIGLGLILARLILNRSNMWLIKTNMVSLCFVLYIISFANLPSIIANYNVDYAHKNPNKPLDVNYLTSLGENAVPALIKIQPIYQSRIAENLSFNHVYNTKNRLLKHTINRYPNALLTRQNDWRTWSFRRYRLLKHLTAMPSTPELNE